MTITRRTPTEELRESLGIEVDAKLKQGGEEGLTDAALNRWLVARKGNIAHAAKDLAAHAEWRTTNFLKNYDPEVDFKSEVDQNKSFLQGYDKLGHPIGYQDSSRHIPCKDVATTKKWIVYSIDALIMMGQQGSPDWDGKIVAVFNMENMGLSNCDFATTKAAFEVLQTHFPERLYRAYLYCAPTVFYAVWKLVQPFVDPVTKEKIVFVYKKDAELEFSKMFDPAVLPTDVGGTATLKPIVQVVNELLAKEREQEQQQHQQH